MASAYFSSTTAAALPYSYNTSLLVQPPAAGGDPFGIPTSGGEWASSDPFADPFGSGSFGSAGWSGDSLAATAELRRKEEEDLARAIKESLKIAKK